MTPGEESRCEDLNDSTGGEDNNASRSSEIGAPSLFLLTFQPANAQHGSGVNLAEFVVVVDRCSTRNAQTVGHEVNWQAGGTRRARKNAFASKSACMALDQRCYSERALPQPIGTFSHVRMLPELDTPRLFPSRLLGGLKTMSQNVQESTVGDCNG